MNPVVVTQHRSWFKTRLATFLGGVLLASIVFGLLLIFNVHPEYIGITTTEVREGGYRFINPLLECEQESGAIEGSKYNFKDHMNAIIAAKLNTGAVKEVAVYYRDLNNGPWFGIDENNAFVPASLLKLPIAMAVLRMEESSPGVLQRKVLADTSYTLPEGRTQLIAPTKTLEAGKEYTVLELIEAALKYSDNHALALLYSVLDTKRLSELYERLGVPTDVLYKNDATLSVRNYATFFRILFNASFLSREHSELLLGLLSQTEFNDGITAGVPPTVMVSHKFGEAGVVAAHQLHDCGIVYHRKYPYILCVMGRGSSLKGIESSIQSISKAAYDAVTKFE
jgi:beta-lactamase class A